MHNAVMAAPGRFDHLRHAALDLLDAGNSMASVAQLLAVPKTVVARWREEPVPPRPDPDVVRATLVAQGHAPSFGTTLVVGRSRPGGLWDGVLGLGMRAALVVGLPAVACEFWSVANFDGEFGVCLTPLAAAAVMWLCRLQVLLRLDARAIVVPGLFGRSVLPYGDLADWWLVMHVKNEGTDEEVEGRLLTLHSRRPRVPPIEVFVADEVVIDPRVLERLDAVKRMNRGATPLTRIGEIPVA
jgi:hypothetical protein